MNTQIFVPESFRQRPYAREHFTRLVAWAAEYHPFYRERLNNPAQHIPLLGRETILAHNEELLNGFPETARTSGSTGIPVRISQSAERVAMENQDTSLFVSWLGGPLPRARIIHTADKEHQAQLLDIKSSLEQQISFIRQRHEEAGAVAVTTYPSNAEALSRAVIEQDIDFGYIRRFGVYAESFDRRQEALIRRAFPNAMIWSTYSSMEFGMIAARCPHEPEYHHIMAHKLGVEILNDNDQPCAPGETGRLVITDYFNKRSPLIRYDIGDLAAPAECPCGKIQLPGLTHIAGKVRGLLKHRDGRRVLFADLSVALRDIPGVKQYQVIQETLEEFLLRIVLLPATDRTMLEPSVHAAFEAHFGYRPHIRIRYESHIGRGDNGKFYASICKI